MNADKEFVPYEQALALKELGFDEPCLAKWIWDECPELMIKGFKYIWTESEIKSGKIKHWKAPLYQQAFRWFSEKHNLHNGIYPYYDEYEFQIKDFRLPTNTPINGGLMKYEEAELACLIKLIEIVKTK
jgi:hypothetical protein